MHRLRSHPLTGISHFCFVFVTKSVSFCSSFNLHGHLSTLCLVSLQWSHMDLFCANFTSGFWGFHVTVEMHQCCFDCRFDRGQFLHRGCCIHSSLPQSALHPSGTATKIAASCAGETMRRPSKKRIAVRLFRWEDCKPVAAFPPTRPMRPSLILWPG